MTELEKVRTNVVGLNFTDALAALQDTGHLVTIEETETDKHDLVGVPLVITSIEIKDSDRVREGEVLTYVLLRGITSESRPFVISDGGVGIAEQIRLLAERDPELEGIYLKGGLRVSQYIHPEHGEAETFYLDMVI